MNVRHVCKWYMVAALAALGTGCGVENATVAQPGQAGAEQGVQVLTRGPVHEAFAEMVTFDPEPGIVVPKAPPAAIEELPPDQKPEGANVAWIPGYWGWDDERSDFLWVSGVWRALPPGRQWVPGYWGKLAQGCQWTSGYWTDAKVTAVQYLPEPPATAEAGPNIAAPSADAAWLPGCWVWQQGRYAWRPGYWAAVQPDWNWVPAHYVYAPRGYMFVDGYWDYSVGRRGVLFAPVYFDAGVYAQPGFFYSPATVINPAVFANCLFLRPQYQHYYFGDYYDASYQAAGFYPSYSYNSGRFGYDPIYAHDRWQHRQDRGWEQRQQADFQNRRDHADARPPRTWAAQRAASAGEVGSAERNFVVAAPFSQVTKSATGPLRFQPVDQLERQKLAQHAQEVQRFREQRQKLETPVAAASAAPPPKGFAPARVPVPSSPIAARPVTELGKEHVPPQVHEAPKLDLRVEPKPRVNRSAPQPQPQPKVVHSIAQPQPQPRVAQPIAQPQPQPKAERPAPQPQPAVERPAPQPRPEPKVERPAPQPRGNAAGAKEDKPKSKDK
jgi:hypothetical protein